MPTYEYECTRCGERLEVKQSMKDDPLKDCPACHTASLRKLLSAPAFQLKGTGWYVTDFRNNKQDKDKVKNEDNKTTDTAAATDDKKADKADKADKTDKTDSATATTSKKPESTPTPSTTTTSSADS
jgi:putative FmdB family regulatory protein